VLPGEVEGVVRAMGGEGDLVRLRLARSCRCFAVIAGDEVVGYGWLSSGTEWIGEIRLEIKPKRGEAYVWNCLTLPAHRRRGMFRALLVRICGVLRAEGVARLWIASAQGGTLDTLAAAGFRPVLAIGESKLAGLRLLRTNAAPNAEAGLVSAARRALATGGLSLGAWALADRPGIRRH
jgi:GNAT superfamily N-acetyltransferase